MRSHNLSRTKTARKSGAIVQGIDLAMMILEKSEGIEIVTAIIAGAQKKERGVPATVTEIGPPRDEAEMTKNERAETDLDLPSVMEVREGAETIAIIAKGENESIHDTNEIVTDDTHTTICETLCETPRDAHGTIRIILQTIGVREGLRHRCNADETSLEAAIQTLMGHRGTLMTGIHGVVILVRTVETGVLGVVLTFAGLPVAVEALHMVDDPWITILLVEIPAIAIVTETATEDLEEIGKDVKQ